MIDYPIGTLLEVVQPREKGSFTTSIYHKVDDERWKKIEYFNYHDHWEDAISSYNGLQTMKIVIGEAVEVINHGIMFDEGEA